MSEPGVVPCPAPHTPCGAQHADRTAQTSG